MKVHGFVNSQCHHVTEAAMEQRECTLGQQSVVPGEGLVIRDGRATASVTKEKKSRKEGEQKELESSPDKAGTQDAQTDDAEIDLV